MYNNKKYVSYSIPFIGNNMLLCVNLGPFIVSTKKYFADPNQYGPSLYIDVFGDLWTHVIKSQESPEAN